MLNILLSLHVNFPHAATSLHSLISESWDHGSTEIRGVKAILVQGPYAAQFHLEWVAPEKWSHDNFLNLNFKVFFVVVQSVRDENVYNVIKPNTITVEN